MNAPMTLTRKLSLEILRRSFWFLPAVAMLVGVVAGLLLPSADGVLRVALPLVGAADATSARTIFNTVATVTASVAGVTFSVVVVALQLASQQLSPRVLRTFQDDRLSQSVLALFVFSFALSLTALLRVHGNAQGDAPDLTIAASVLSAVVAFAFFVAFVHHIITSLQASTLIRRIAADGRRAIRTAFPAGIGDDPSSPAQAWSRARERMAATEPTRVCSPRAGYVEAVDGHALMRAAEASDAFVRQAVKIGDFVVTGGMLAEVWTRVDDSQGVADSVVGAFRFARERTPYQDVAFPLRQLADVALRGLSPGINDPTTAENAMNSLADTLVRFARAEQPQLLRVDGQGTPRLAIDAPDLDDLVRLGFDQVRSASAQHPLFTIALLRLLAEVRRAAASQGLDAREARRQAGLLRDGAVEHALTEADRELVEDAYAELHTD